MIEPGDFKTGFTANRENIKNDKGLLDKSRKIIEHDEQNGQPPIKIAKLIAKIILMKKPKLRYAIGAFDQKLSIFLKKILPVILSIVGLVGIIVSVSIIFWASFTDMASVITFSI